MKLFGFNISRLPRHSAATAGSPAPRHSDTPVQRSLDPSLVACLRGANGHTGSVLSNAYEQVVWVYRAINVLAEQVANIPFLFSSGERGRETLITRGPLRDF